MTTTSSTTSSTASTASTTSSASTTASSTSTNTAQQTATQQLLNSLGTGSGVDTATLVNSLVEAQYATKADALTSQLDKLTTQISDTSTLLSGITGFATSLDTLVKGGTLQTSPTSSNTSLLTVSGQSGAKLAGLSATIQINQLATAQSATTGVIADKTAAVGTGSLSIQLGTATYDSSGAMTGFTAGSGSAINVSIDSSNDSLTGIAAAINAAGAGVTASVVTDTGGARLMLRGKTGAAQAFTMTATEDSAAPGLAALNVGVGATGTTIGAQAQDAKIVLDGTTFSRSSNTVTDLLSGVNLNLVGASPGTTITIGTSAPTDAITQAVTDFVDTYNQMYSLLSTDLDVTSGSLYNDSAARNLKSSLAKMTTTALIPSSGSGAPTTLAEIGVETNEDGTLQVDSTKLSTMMTSWPDQVEAMFAAASSSSSTSTTSQTGLSAVLDAISTAAQDKTVGLNASTTTYTKKKSDVTDQQTALTTQEATTRTNLTQVYATMESRITAYKSTQSYLTAQVAAWNKSTS